MMQGTRNSLWYPDVFLWHSSCCILPYRSLLWSMVECSLAHGGVWSRWHKEFFGAALSGATEVLNQGCYPQMRPFLHVKWNNRVHQLFPLWFFSYTYILSFSERIKDILGSWNLIAVLSSGLTKNHFMNSTFSCLQWSFSSGLPLKSLWKFHWHSHNLQWYSPFHASVSWQWCPYDSFMDWSTDCTTPHHCFSIPMVLMLWIGIKSLSAPIQNISVSLSRSIWNWIVYY